MPLRIGGWSLTPPQKSAKTSGNIPLEFAWPRAGKGKRIATAPAKKAWKLILFAVEERRLGAVSGIMGLPLVFLILKGSVFL